MLFETTKTIFSPVGKNTECCTATMIWNMKFGYVNVDDYQTFLCDHFTIIEMWKSMMTWQCVSCAYFWHFLSSFVFKKWSFEKFLKLSMQRIKKEKFCLFFWQRKNPVVSWIVKGNLAVIMKSFCVICIFCFLKNIYRKTLFNVSKKRWKMKVWIFILFLDWSNNWNNRNNYI